jgi:NLI interacting factor-like phosphatase
MFDVIALDLEGTLISNAMSQFPRPGLYNFLVAVKRLAHRVVMFTGVQEPLFRQIAATLCQEGKAPSWFLDIGYVEWDHLSKKDLIYIKNIRIERSVIIDDMPEYIKEEHMQQFVHIRQYESPYSLQDRELERILAVLQEKVEHELCG